MAAPTLIHPKHGDAPPGPPRYHVVVLGRDGAVAHRLPAAGDVLIGRDETADIRVVDPSASRHHARIHVGDAVEIEDLGSANGTRLGSQPLEPRRRAPLAAGSTIAIGATVLVVHGGDPEFEAQHVWAHGYLEVRLIEACARAQGAGSTFALARIHVQGHAPAALIEHALASALRGGDLLAAYGPSDYEVLLPDSSEGVARAITDRMLATLATKKLPARCGVAFYPADGTSPQSLVGRAAERVRPADGPTATSIGVVVASAAMRELYAVARRAAAATSNVLIVGETGAGKEVLAETVHRLSPRAGNAFLPLNCAALSESLVESELFGHEKGAFTGALQTKLGLLEAADGGTLFLDEIGEMPIAIQAKLLRVIETRQVLRVGAVKPRAVDVRLVAATNRDLEEEVAEKRFREDLYFRLNVITLEIPPLRERPEEIEALARLFLGRLAHAAGAPASTLTGEAVALLLGYAWPGNVRELRNVIERAFVLSAGAPIAAEHLPVDKLRRNPWPATAPGVADPPRAAPGGPPPATLPLGLKQIERQAIVDALERCSFNQTRAAELLGMPRRTFCKRMKEYAIPRPRA